MTKDQISTLLFLEDFLLDKDTKNIKAISTLMQLRSEFPNIKTLYGRSRLFNNIEDDYELYKIFYSTDYYGDSYAPKGADCDNVCEYIQKSQYNLIIQDNKTTFMTKKRIPITL